MRMYDLILKKRNGNPLSKLEIDFFVNGYTTGKIPDYQASALLMAIYFQKMTKEETAHLTLAMANSGQILDLSQVQGIKVDKHSTGGVGDKVSLVLAPLVASAGVKVPKMSGRGLGHTGGTIDKLESIPGFKADLTQEQFINNVNAIGMAIAGQTADLAPADKKLYALRDTTATVDNISLIAASVMSKKIASGADKILLDVKTGSGAFMKTVEDSLLLAKEMVEIGTNVGRETVAVISDMDQPLGLNIGNALEVKEAIATLQGHGPQDLEELCLTLGAHMLVLAEKSKDIQEGRQILEDKLKNSSAYQTFKKFIIAQGGDPLAVSDPENYLPKAKESVSLKAWETGFINRILAEQVGLATLTLGAGRETKESPIDLSVGVTLHKKVGEEIRQGERIATIYYNDEAKAEAAFAVLKKAVSISSAKPEPRPLVFSVVTP
ncbi:MAG: pyrimidine-nucleoside phosphorylase [Zhaonellaceae bacterium]|jgi:pyrimidine-nucleoside phosphorylase|nr:pyrimidine-nucleoside phosphorylase [Clostridia bacterium]